VATEDLTRALDEAGAAYELLPHAHTESALAEAEALGLEPDDVAKTLIVKTREGYLRAVVQAFDRLDERKVRDLTGGSKKDVHLASEDDLRRDYLTSGKHALAVRVPTSLTVALGCDEQVRTQCV
jgi:prolyl-tRNA editing enzyme YbaK/EbsC (Cys-tRNA(Pro) deacylase)